MNQIRFLVTTLALLWMLVPDDVMAQQNYKSRTEAQFQSWLKAQWPTAQKNGISRQTFDLAFKEVKLNWRLPDLAPPGRKTRDKAKRRQSEFGSPGRYFRQDNINALVQRGRQMKKKWSKTLAKIERRYGVPQNIILAVWGRETSFGAVKIPYDTIRSLATLSFMGRRQSFFYPELIGALQILEQGHISRNRLKSSWAGAMGQTQMLPQKFLQYAVDFDGDGRKNIWTSPPDALATTANFLKQQGWQNRVSWGYEIALTPAVNCTLEGPHRMQPIKNWVNTGLKRTAGRKFSSPLLQGKGSLLLPAGLHGPGFIVTENFYVLKKYNESDLYALFVGHLADRISTNKQFIGKWQKVSTYTRAKIKHLQKTLQREGYNIGKKVDGLIGFRSRVAVGLYQNKYGLEKNCWPGKATLSRASR
ncbi:Membrane-bound lytic murein transglycosylase B [hydrothermal vent metagenome]|uniref:Membrane-bound lytic murein transglycosylase B n=1 Tax=hydrothermal vent metagenome TaxID=652676 RepID=A0A3B0RPV8_9ZZZZ